MTPKKTVYNIVGENLWRFEEHFLPYCYSGYTVFF